VLQQRAAGEAPLHHPLHVSLLMHLAAAQAPTRGRQERAVRPRVSPVAQVRDACHIYMQRYTFSDSCLTASLYIVCMINMVMIYMYTYIYSYSWFTPVLHIYIYIYTYILLFYMHTHTHTHIHTHTHALLLPA
jgi:hypothetical protein